MRTLTWITPLLLISAAAAQGIVTPANFAIAEADSYSSNGIGAPSSCSYLGIYEDMAGKTATLRGVSFRRDGESFTTTTFPTHTWQQITIKVSTAATTGAAPDTVFANNHGPDVATVLSGGFVFVPESSFSGPASPWEYSIPFSQPFSWTGGGPLCIEVRIGSKSPSTVTVYLDFVNRASNANPAVVTRSTGEGCIASGETVAMRLTPSYISSWSTGAVTLSYSGRYMPPTTGPSSLVVLLVGASQSLGGVPLPLEIPYTVGLPGGPPSHSGSCYLHNDVLVQLYGFVDATGRMSLDQRLRVTPAFNGLTLYTTAVAVDPAANPFGVITSNGTQHHLVAPWPGAASPYGHGSVYQDGTGTARAFPNRALVIRLDT